jgi:hypothetical protein
MQHVVVNNLFLTVIIPYTEEERQCLLQLKQQKVEF